VFRALGSSPNRCWSPRFGRQSLKSKSDEPQHGDLSGHVRVWRVADGSPRRRVVVQEEELSLAIRHVASFTVINDGRDARSDSRRRMDEVLGGA